MTVKLLDESATQKWQNTRHFDVDAEIIVEWQAIIELMAKIMDVPAALIMQRLGNELSVFVKSNNEDNPYKEGEKAQWFGSGLYCEHVLRTGKRLFIPNALEDKDWKNNPDIKLKMINYLGLPIIWPNGDPFGTICVLDNRARYYSKDQQDLIRRFKSIIESHLLLIENNAELKALSMKLEKLAHTDALTNILNRRAFFEQSNAELCRSERYENTFSFLMIDVDHFKLINDQYGHHVGDEVLKILTKTIQSMKRADDIFGRIGGEEFAIILPETGLEPARQFAERIRQTISELSIAIDKHMISITVSIGGMEYNDTVTEIQQAMDQADHALYQAKESGRNSVVFD